MIKEISSSLSPEQILALFKDKDVDRKWSFEEYKPSQRGKWTHDYHRYPAKFIPQLVEKLMDEYITSEDAHINDPFHGCGTTIVTAISRGHRASGTDINRIANLMTRVKSTPIEPEHLEKKCDTFLSRIRYIDSAQGTLFRNNTIEPLIPERHEKRIDFWFDAETKTELGIILEIISEEEDSKVREFLLLAFSHILKNCSRWAQGSTKPTRDPNKNPMRPYHAFKKHLKRMTKGNWEFFQFVPKRVRDDIDDHLNVKISDARHQPVDDNDVDLIVSSSPYVTSYEYADLHQLSTIWLDLAEDLTEYKREFIGTSHKQYEMREPSGQIARDIVRMMRDKNKKVAKEIEAFFIDMEEVFKESYRIMRNGGRCCFVIGDTSLRGVDIFNAEVFVESLQYSGFMLDRVIKREIHSKILPQKRDKKTGRFASNHEADSQAYPAEYIVMGLKE